MIFQAIARRREARPRAVPEFTPATRNVRPLVQEPHQQAPDPSLMGGAYGELRARLARIQVYTATHPWEYVSEDRFVAVNPEYAHTASLAPGAMAPIVHRTNIRVPPHVAYGSLFEYAGG